MAGTEIRSAGDCVEAVDSLGYWTRAKVVKWVNEGEVLTHGGDDEDVGPGFEVQFDGWSQEWNRIVSPSEIRDVTIVSPPAVNKTSRRCPSKNVAMLKLHKDDVREVLVDGEQKEATICQVDPISNNVIVDIAGTKATLQLENLIVHKESRDCSPCDTDTPRKAKKQKTKSGLRKPPAAESPEQDDERMEEGMEEGKLPLQLALGSSFFQVGEICSFLGNLLVIISSIVFCTRTKATRIFCKVCTVVGETVTEIEAECELQCQANQLQKTNSIKTSHSLRSTMKAFQACALVAVGNVAMNSTLSYQRMQRKLKLGFLLRESCLELLKSRSLKKTVTNLFEPLDLVIFSFGNPQHTIQYVIEENFSELDVLMGSMWDVHRISPTVPDEHFFFIRSVSVNVNSVKLILTLTKGRSIFPFSENYRELAVQSLRSGACETMSV